jgi:Flp pilus assembly pilin Flp
MFDTIAEAVAGLPLPAGLRHIADLESDCRGVTALEYGIVATFLCLSLLGIFSRFGSVLVTMFSGVTTSI